MQLVTFAKRSVRWKHDNSADKTNKNDKDGMKYTYVHPLSQIVLEEIQQQQQQQQQQTMFGEKANLKLKIHESNGTIELTDNDQTRIWTTFDSVEKKHWLCAQYGDQVGQFLLQDNLQPAWHTDPRSKHEKVQHAVQELLQTLSPPK